MIVRTLAVGDIGDAHFVRVMGEGDVDLRGIVRLSSGNGSRGQHLAEGVVLEYEGEPGALVGRRG